MGRLQVNYNSNKNNRISIKKQNIGGGKINAFFNLLSHKPIITYLDTYYDGENGIEYGVVVGFDKVGIPDFIVSDYQIDLFNFKTFDCEDPQIGTSIFFNESISSLKYSNNIEYTFDPTYFQVRIRAVSKSPNTYSQWSDTVSFGNDPCN